MSASPPTIYEWRCAVCDTVTQCVDDGLVLLNKGKCDPHCAGRDLHIWKYVGTAASFEGPRQPKPWQPVSVAQALRERVA